jgi:hypothetical protein
MPYFKVTYQNFPEVAEERLIHGSRELTLGPDRCESGLQHLLHTISV